MLYEIPAKKAVIDYDGDIYYVTESNPDLIDISEECEEDMLVFNYRKHIHKIELIGAPIPLSTYRFDLPF